MIRKTHFLKILALFAGITILYSAAISFIFYTVNVNNFIEQQEKYHDQLSTQIAMQNDNKIRTTLNLMRLMQHSKTLNAYLSDTSSDYNMTLFSGELSKNNTIFTGMGADIAVYDLNSDLIFTGFSTTNKSNFFKKIGFSHKQTAKLHESLRHPSESKMLVLASDEPNEIRYLSIAYSNTINGKPIVFLAYYDINEFMKYHFLLPEEKIHLVFNSKIYSESDVLTELYGKSVDALLESDFFEDYSCSGYVVPSSYINLRYIVTTSKEPVYNYQKQFMIRCMLLMLILIAVGIGISLFMSRKAYSPILGVLSVFKSYGAVKGKDDVEFIKHTAYEIQSTNIKLSSYVDDYKKMVKSRLLKDLLNQITPSSGHDVNDFSSISYNPTAVLIEFSQSTEGEVYNIVLENLLSNAEFELYSMITELNNITCEIVTISHGSYVVVVNSYDVKKLTEKITMLAVNLNEDFNINICAFVGERAPNIMSIHKSYSTIKDLMEYRYSIGERSIFTADDIKMRFLYYFPFSAECDLVNNTIKGKEKETLQILDKLFQENFYNGSINNEARIQFILTITSCINRIVQYQIKSEDEIHIDCDELMQEFKQCKTREALTNRINEIFAQLLGHFKKSRNSVEEYMTEQLVEYIRMNYPKDISLLDIATYFNITPGYASSLFKNLTGENFKEYLNYFRIEKAKEHLLGEEDIKIKELSTMVGYNNVNTFLRIFKKYENTSPGKYREIHLNN